MELTVISPGGVVLHEKADKVTMPGVAGSFTVLPMHAPIIAALGAGKVRYGMGYAEKEYEISGGIVEVDHDRVRILVK